LLLLSLVPACAHQKSAAEQLKDAQAHVAVNAAIARGDLVCRTEKHTGSEVAIRVCYFRGEREYRRAVNLRYFQGNSPQAVPPVAVTLGETTPQVR
jgi:hypothetical protein